MSTNNPVQQCRLVPVEPTVDMQIAGAGAIYAESGDEIDATVGEVAAAYRAMLAAAPQPAQEPRDWKAEFGAMQAHAADLSAQLLAMQRAQPAQHVRDAAAAIADAQPAPKATGIVEDMAHRLCWRYKHSSDPAHSHTYTFNRSTLLAFADALLDRQRQHAKEAEARAVAAEYAEGKGVLAERERYATLIAELRHIATRCELPDGDYVSVILQMWAEDWMRKIEWPNV